MGIYVIYRQVGMDQILHVSPDLAAPLMIFPMGGTRENVTRMGVALVTIVLMASNWLGNRRDFAKRMALGPPKSYPLVFVSNTIYF